MFSCSLHKCKICGKVEYKQNFNHISHARMLFLIVLFYVGLFYNPQNVPNNTTLLSNMLCIKLSSFHLHNWANGEGIWYLFHESKIFYFGDPPKVFGGGGATKLSWRSHGSAKPFCPYFKSTAKEKCTLQGLNQWWVTMVA